MNKTAILLVLFTTLAACVSRAMLPGHNLSVTGTVEVLQHFWVASIATAAVYEWRDNTKESRGLAFLMVVCLILASGFELFMFIARGHK